MKSKKPVYNPFPSIPRDEQGRLPFWIDGQVVWARTHERAKLLAQKKDKK